MINYRALLKKYMDHVSGEEGITFVSRINSDWRGDFSRVEFTQEEVEELKSIESEISS